MGAACRKACLGKSNAPAAGSVLDQVISQASADDPTVLYKLANYKKGGLLVEEYTRGGQVAAEHFIRERLAAYMYAGGAGQAINRAEYLRWKFRDQDHVVLPIEASLSRHDPLARWSDHGACWQMRYRGALGESLLHLLIICDTRIHTRLARTLLKCFPRLSLDVVEGEEYLGASSLHLAIAYSNNELVQDLIEAGADVSQRAIGSFFLPRDQQTNPPSRRTDYEGLAYLGEYPLAWAACCANEAVYNLLLDSGADPDMADTFGNMILHMVVVCDKLDMFGYALRHPKMPASNGRMNAEGLTPLTLACKLGRAEVFKEMLELSAREFWRYSNITCSAYPLNALDTLLPDGRTNWNSALFIILNGTKEEHLDMLDGGIIQRLLEEKWKTFARNQFLKRLLILFIHLVLLSCGVYLRPGAEAPLLGAPEGARDVLRYLCEVGTLLGVLSYVVLQQGDELKNQGLSAFVKQLGHAPAKAIFLVSNFLLLACIPCRLAGHKTAEEAILVFAVPGSWFLLMFFAGAVRLTGPFVTMIYSMITGDMLTFGIIYSIVLFGFSQSFFFLYKGFPNVKSSLFASYPSTWMALLQITLGDYSYSDLGQTTYPNLAKSVFALFMVFVPILLLNMLIAMMGNTYAHVIEQSEKEWMKQWAKIVVTLERAVPAAAAHHYLQEYSLGLGPSDDPRYEQRAVMVIKSKAKTRAKQRKGAVSNWKRVGKVTIAELRRRGITGEELRRIMWGRASISTPTKIPIKPLPPLLSSSGPDLVGGFGTALTSALDVISFTHDLDISTASNGLNLQSAHLIKSVAQPTTPTSLALPAPALTGSGAPASGSGALGTHVSGVDAASSITSMLHQYSEAQGPADLKTTTSVVAGSHLSPQTVLGTNIPQTKQPTHPTQQPVQLQVPMRPNIQQSTPSTQNTYPDQLRELILLSIRKDSLDHSEKIKLLAKEAADLEHVEEVTIVVKPLSIGQARGPTVAGALSGLFGVETNVSTVSWNREKEKAPKHLEPSDSEGFGEVPLLGRVSRRRRARSATHNLGVLNGVSSLVSSGVSRRMVSRVSGSSSDAAPELANGAAKDGDFGDLDYAAARIQQLSNSTMHIYRYPKQRSTAGGTEATEVALRAARPRVIDRAALNSEPLVADHAGLVQGEGYGAEDQSGNRPLKERRKWRRPQTARTNKVAPAERASRPRRGRSARDPLAAWSTAGLQPMGRLLPDCSSPSPSPSDATLELE